MLKNAGVSVLCCILALCTAVFLFAEKNNDENIKSEDEIVVYIADENINATMKTEEYVASVLRGEMPATFEEEALKAQAVAIRTYVKKKSKTKNDKHPDAVVCTDYSHCMAYVDAQKATDNWKDKFDEYNNKILKAVNVTKGEIVTYNGEAISAVFHSMSSGKTENSYEVWNGNEVPYLKSVNSAEEHTLEGFNSEAKVDVLDFCNKLDIEKFDNPEYEYTEGGAVKTLFINGKEFKGTDVRKIFNLRSANFEIVKNENNIVFLVKGYGHGVGMSQYGANQCAKQGMTYKDILKKYYTDVEITKL